MYFNVSIKDLMIKPTFCPPLLMVATLRKTESDPVDFVTAAPTKIPLGNAKGGRSRLK